MVHSVSLVFAVLLAAFSLSFASTDFPLEETVQLARNNLLSAPTPIPTGLTKKDYLQTSASIVGFFRTLQDASGAILDPFTLDSQGRPREVQYGTPTFAFAAVTLGLELNDEAVLESGIRALNHSLKALSSGKCPDSHCNFFTHPIMATCDLLRPHVSSGLWSYWMALAKAIPSDAINWGVIAAAGDYIRYLFGQTSTSYFESTFRTHLKHFSENGMYKDPVSPVENPSMTYDLFPRVYMEDVLRRGYNGTLAANLSAALTKGALSSLLLQSPNGELPTGGRSSQHQWNEAIELFLFEVRANIYKQAGDMVMASAFKRAAHIALQSIRKWFHPDGYLYIVKNRVSLAEKFGYERYSHLTNYNGIPACFLAMAYNIADDTIPEGPSFAETGGFVFETPSHHKIVANVKGNYYEWETQAQLEYDTTGLSRIQHPNTNTLIGPNAGATNNTNIPLNIGLAWTKNGYQESLAQFGTGTLVDYAKLNIVSVSQNKLEFSITYDIQASAAGVSQVVESVVLTENKATISTTLDGQVDSVEFKYPIFVYDGLYNTSFDISANQVTMYGGISQTYTVESPSGVELQFNDSRTPMRNGFFASAYASVSPSSVYVISIEHNKGALPTTTYSVGPSSTFQTISAAVDAARANSGAANFIIEVEPGNYREKVILDVDNLVLRAVSSPVIISYLGTIDSDASLLVTARNVKVYGISVINTRPATAGIGSSLYVNPPSANSESSFYGCSFYGFKNTIVFATSLVTAYFKDCFIEGGSDVIVGAGTVYFESCTLASNGPGSITAMTGIFNYATLIAQAPSSIIAAYRPTGPSSVYASASSAAGQNYLGRAGDSFSRVTFMFSTLNRHINVVGWATAGLQFQEFQNTGPSSFGKQRITSAKLLNGAESAHLTLEDTFGATPVNMPQWIDYKEFPECGYIYSYCNSVFFENPNCCRPGLSCVQESSEISRCKAVSLSEPSNGETRVYQSATFGLSTIYITNAWGPITFSHNSTTLNAYFDVSYKNAVVESIYLDTTPTPSESALYATVVYSSRSDPRGGVAVGLHITLPVENPIDVIFVPAH